MKRIICIVLLLSVFCGCTATPDSQPESEVNLLLDEKFDTEEKLPAYDMQNQYMRFRTACESEETYYFRPKRGTFIYFYDKKSGKADVLCGRPECSHDSQDCNAYGRNRCGICYYENKIYFLKDERLQSVLYAVDPDGTNLCKIQVLKSDMNGTNPMMRMHRGYIYTAVIKHEVTEGENSTRVIVQREILGQEGAEPAVVYEEVLENSEYGIDFYLQAEGNTLYILINKQNVDTDPGTLLAIHAYDMKTGRLDTVGEGTYKDVFVSDYLVQEDTAYITLYDWAGSNYLLSCDLEEGKMGELTEIPMEDTTLFPGLQEDVVVGYKGATKPAYYITDFEGTLIRQGELPKVEGQEEAAVALMGRLDEGILFTLSSHAGEPSVETLVLVPLDEKEEIQILWRGESVTPRM